MKNYLKDNCEVIDNHIIKIDHIINHQIDVDVLDKIAQEIADCYKDEGVNKILTVETSGIALALLVAQKLSVNNIVYGKKQNSIIMSEDVYSEDVYSYTKQVGYKLLIAKKFLSSDDRVLIVDDILANGEVMKAMDKVCASAGCHVVGKHVIVNKGFSNDLTDVGSVLKVDSIVDNILL